MSLYLKINGTAYILQSEITIRNLLTFLGIEPNSIALEQNQIIVPKDNYESQIIKNNDQIEIVSIVGGG